MTSTSASPTTTNEPVTSTASGSVAEVDGGVCLELLQLVVGGDRPDRAAARAHHQRVGAAASGAVAHALHQLAVGDAGGHEEDVVPGDQVLGLEHVVRVEVVAGVERALPLLVVLRPQPALDDTVEALHRTGRDDAFRGAADTQQQVDAG